MLLRAVKGIGTRDRSFLTGCGVMQQKGMFGNSFHMESVHFCATFAASLRTIAQEFRFETQIYSRLDFALHREEAVSAYALLALPSAKPALALNSFMAPCLLVGSYRRQCNDVS